MNSKVETCLKHNKHYHLIGIDQKCDLNCRICIDCLKGIDGVHKKGVSNHETISVEQLNHHFDQLQQHHIESIMECNEAVQKYFRSFENLLKEQMAKEKQRLSLIIRKILLTQITKDNKKLDIILGLYSNDTANITCRQVGFISHDLFHGNFHHQSSLGFKKFLQYITQMQGDIFMKFTEVISSKSWSRTILKDCQKQIMFPEFEEPGLKASRVKTEQDSPKKTLRKSVKKKLDLKDLSVQLKRPLELHGCALLENREEQVFLSKLFEHKSVKNAKLLFRASQNNYSVKEFHKLCDGIPNTLTLVKTQFNKVIGGFTPIPWKSTANTLHSDIKSQSFLFSISLKQKMSLVDDKSAIFNSVNFGPTFGAGADLAICHNGNVQKTSYSEFPYSYANSRYKQPSQHTTTSFTGQKNGNHFLLKQWQVWRITFQ